MPANRSEQRRLVSQLQERLALIWGIIFAIGFILMLLLGSRLGSARTQGWGWFTQTFVPTAGIVISGIVAAQRRSEHRRVSRFFFRFTCCTLVFYGLVALATPLIGPANVTLLAWLEMSSVWLGVAQGAIAGLVVFSFSQSGEKSETKPGSAGG
jgi:hypothetical protein